MLRGTPLLLFDSFREARGNLAPLFAASHGAQQTLRIVRRHILSRSRHLASLSQSQQRSWVRANVSLVLQESRRRRSFAVAEAALRVALEGSELIAHVDPTWVKDAAACCQSPEQLASLQRLLSEYTDRLASLHSGRGADGSAQDASLLSVLLGASAGPPRAVQLGDADGASALSALAPTGDDIAVAPNPGDQRAGREALLNTLSAEERVAVALSRPSGGAHDETQALAPHVRMLAAMRRLEHDRELATVSPNQSFSRYFIRQGIVRSEPELSELFHAMRARPARIGFRVHLSHSFGAAAARVLRGREGISPVPWMPEHAGAFTLNCHHVEALQRNRALLHALAKERIISFQTPSSMLPVRLLAPQPGERVLDLCAAPGSKSTLILDMMNTPTGPISGAASWQTADVGAGCVCANEADAARARELADRLRNFGPQVVLTRSPGEHFGELGGQGRSSPAGSSVPSRHADSRAVLDVTALSVEDSFDKVLVDAPCSGEGRMGRDVMAWRLWHPGKALEFFPRQVALLQRAVEVCRPGGTVVYATCTLNPLENEAVVSTVLRRYAGCVQLEPPAPLTGVNHSSAADANALLSGNGEEGALLRLDAGLRQWVVPSGSGGFYSTAAEARAQEGHMRQLPPGVFCPAAEVTAADAARGVGTLAEQLHRCCRRVLPHHNERGTEGFFVAVLKKTNPTRGLRALLTKRDPQQSPSDHADSTSRRRVGASLLAEYGLERLSPTSEVVQSCLAPFFSTSSAVSDPIQRIMSRGGDGAPTFLSESGLVPLWHRTEGLRLASESAVALADLLPSMVDSAHDGPSARGTRGHNSPAQRGSSSACRLLDLGVLAFTSAGSLTERGASLLAPYATSRVLLLPLTFWQLLLANQQLDVRVDRGATTEDPLWAARRTASNRLLSSRPAHGRGTDSSTMSSWAAAVCEQVRVHGPGNAIVMVTSTALHAHAASDGGALPARTQLDGRGGLAEGMRAWTLPVHVEVTPPSFPADAAAARRAAVDAASTPADTPLVRPPEVKLRLLLSRDARARCLAMIGRLQRSDARTSTEKTVREYIKEGSAFNVSDVMAPSTLHGSVLDEATRVEALLGRAPATAAAAAPPTTGAESHKRSERVFDDSEVLSF